MKEVELHQPDEEVVEVLEEILERAKKGEIVGFAMVCDIQGGTTAIFREGMLNSPMAVGQLELMKWRLLRTWSGDYAKDDDDA